MDLDKHFQEAEAYGTSSKRDESEYKRKGFERRIDRAKEDLKHADSEKREMKLERVIKESERIYRKHSGTIYSFSNNK